MHKPARTMRASIVKPKTHFQKHVASGAPKNPTKQVLGMQKASHGPYLPLPHIQNTSAASIAPEPSTSMAVNSFWQYSEVSKGSSCDRNAASTSCRYWSPQSRCIAFCSSLRKKKVASKSDLTHPHAPMSVDSPLLPPKCIKVFSSTTQISWNCNQRCSAIRFLTAQVVARRQIQEC